MQEITLWFGNTGTKMDCQGNVYGVKKDTPEEPEYIKQNLVEIYQSILEELGYTVQIEEKYLASGRVDEVRHVVYHTVRGSDKTEHPNYRKRFVYAYPEPIRRSHLTKMEPY